MRTRKHAHTRARAKGDIDTLTDARKKLAYAAANHERTQQPFFLGVGIHKPHMDWRVPPHWIGLYPPAATTTATTAVTTTNRTHTAPAVASHPTTQAGRPPVSIHCPYQAASFEKLWTGWGYTSPWAPMRPESAAEMRRYVATFFIICLFWFWFWFCCLLFALVVKIPTEKSTNVQANHPHHMLFLVG